MAKRNTNTAIDPEIESAIPVEEEQAEKTAEKSVVNLETFAQIENLVWTTKARLEHHLAIHPEILKENTVEGWHQLIGQIT